MVYYKIETDAEIVNREVFSNIYFHTIFRIANNVTYNSSNVILQQGSPAIGVATKTYTKAGLANYETKSSYVTYALGTTSFNYIFNPGYNQSGNLVQYTDVNDTVYASTYPAPSDPYISQHKRNNNLTTNYVWGKTNNLLLSEQRVSTPSNYTIDYTYDANKNLTKKKYTTTLSGNREWNYSYTSLGKIQTVEEPTGAITNYSYYPDNDINPNNRGQVYQVTNAIGQAITMNSYDSRGNPTSITMPSGLVKTYTYNDMSQALTQTATNSLSQSVTTSYTYDLNGDVTSITKPSGEVINMEYDNLMRLTRIYNNLNDETIMSYDENSNLIKSQTNKSTNLLGEVNAQFDGLNRKTQMWKSNALQKYTTSYNAGTKMNPQETTDPNNKSEGYTFTNGVLNVVNNGWGDYIQNNNNALFNPDVTYIGGDSTNRYFYTYNDYEEIITQNDYNTGNKTFAYDVANRKVTMIDASSTSHVNQKDLLGRTASITSTNGATVLVDSFTYDNDGTLNNFAKGQITSLNNASASVAYVYGPWSLPTTYIQALTAPLDTKTINYTYDSIGQNNSMSLPSGLIINYAYDKGKIKNVTTSGLITSNILKDAVYYPFTNNIQSFSWDYNSNINSYLKNFNPDGRISSIQSVLNGAGILNYSYTYDGADNILTQTDNVAVKTNTYTYSLNRVASSNDGTTARTYSYTNYKNLRSIQTETGQPNISYGYDMFPYDNNGARIIYETKSGTPTKNYSYDARGNVLSLGTGTTSMTYDIKNRTTSTTNPSSLTTNYLYNALNQRVYKSNTSGNIHYLYDGLTQQLVGEYELGTSNYVEYIYLQNMLVAINKNGTLYYVHSDHLNTPRKVTDSLDSVVFDWKNAEAFGANLPTTNTIGVNIRFPGQYFDIFA